MRFTVLGPLEVSDGDRPVEVHGLMPRTLLAALLLRANATVTSERLIEILWGENSLASASSSLQNHVLRLRRMLGDAGGARIRTMPSGYLCQVEPGELDLHSFTELCAEGRAAGRGGRWAKSAMDLAGALALWRGAPIGDIPGLAGQEAQIQQLTESRWQAWEGRIEADLQLGRHAELIGELRALTADHPLRETFHGQLMLALYRADRQAEALDAYARLRRTLLDELAVDPSTAIQDLHRRILDADPGLNAPAPSASDPVATAAAIPVPLTAPTPVPIITPAPAVVRTAPVHRGHGSPRYQLPADTRVFTGRRPELGRLAELARQVPQGTESGMVVISAIDGMAGIGKTTLAVHAAHQVRAEFPDGQLFLDLHGFTTGLEPMTAGDALNWLLRTLGVPPQLIPADLGERAAYYRDQLDGTRTLIILDNASSAAQVRPLLPGGPGSLVLVTSRKRLTGLDDAYSLSLDTLPEEDAVSLLEQVAGPDRLPAGHPAILELITLCGHMPLAIRITAARLRHHRSLRIEDVVDQLRDETARLDRLQDEDRDLTAVFDLSYQGLPSAEQHLFRFLGLVPGPDFDVRAAAALTGTDLRTAERLLDSLLDHNLLTQHTNGRFRFHDLIRLYARTLADQDPAGERDEAQGRLLDYYRHAAAAADRQLARQARPEPLLATATPSDSPSHDRAEALAWMRTEHDNLLAAIAHAVAGAQSARVVALTAVLAAFLQQEGPWPQAAALHQAAAATAHDLGDSLAEANALSDLGRIRQVTGDHAAATGFLEQALAIYQDLGNRQGEANADYDLARTHYLTGDYPAATALLDHSLATYQDLGDRQGEANALCDLGRVRFQTGDSPAATGLLEQALAIYLDLGVRLGEANTLQYLGQVQYANGDYPAAGLLQERALTIFQELGTRLGEANTLQALGQVRHATGDYPAAAELHERSLTIYQDLGTRMGEANALFNLGRARHATGDHQAAGELLERALTGFRNLNARIGEANALHDLGQVRHATGDYPVAAKALERALAIFHEVGDRQGEAEVLNSTGALIAETAGPQEALLLYRRALSLAREAQSPRDEAHALEGAARALARTGDRAGARAELRESIALYRRIGAPQAESAAAFLATLEPAATARPARAEDLAALPGIEDAADELFAANGVGPMPGSAGPQDLATALAILVVGEPVVGFARIDLVDGLAHLEQLSVLPNQGRRGLGAELLAAACRWAAEHGHGAITLSTFADVPWNAPFYARHGFIPVPDADLTPGLQALRQHEQDLGLHDFGRRTVMRKKL